MVYRRDVSRAVGALILPKSKPRRRADPGTVKDGWHTVKGIHMLVEDGRVVTAWVRTSDPGTREVQFCTRDPRDGVWIAVSKPRFSAVRNGIYKGTYRVI